MTTAPTLVSLASGSAGTTIDGVVVVPAGVDDLKVLYRATTASAWTELDVSPADTSFEISGLTEGELVEVCVVGLDAAAEPSLPSITMRRTPASDALPIGRRIEKDVVAALEAVATTAGDFDDMDRVWRFSFPVDVTGQSGMFAIVAFPSVEHQVVAHSGNDVIDDCRMRVEIAIARNGRDGTEDWIADSAHQMLASIQIALMADTTRGGYAIDTTHQSDGLSENQERMGDAVAGATYGIYYRTYRSNPLRNAV